MPPRISDCVNPAEVGTGSPPKSTELVASTAPMTAAAVLVPSERNSAFKPFEAPDSLCGTERMMSIGIEA